MNVANNNKLMNIIDMHVEKYAPVTEAGSSTGERIIILYLILVVMKQVLVTFLDLFVLLHVISMNVIMIG
ncbi:MAG TPA: hypothetical protein OIL95_03065 [Coprobacillaceae bacterium]|nr:hypothetical protein [Coprobacillaceae bacterium]